MRKCEMWNHNAEMKKSGNSRVAIAGGNNHHVPKEGVSELAKRIHKSISERVRTLDDARGCAAHVRDLFAPSVQVHRSKLQEYCERLIFAEPLTFGLKLEELLWRRAYYDVIATAKRLKQQRDYAPDEKAALNNHINAGIGHYHHHISRLQTEFEVCLNAEIDFYIISNQETKADKAMHDWCVASVHRSLIYLGDLCRYKLEIFPNGDPNIAIRYYSQALLLRPEFGMPHNQMGTLSTALNQHLDATYHYIQCMMSKNSFDGAENNLHRLFERNAQYLEQLPIETPSEETVQLEPTEHVRRFIARFLLLTDVWFFNKKIPHIYDLCHQTNVDLQECLSFLRPVASENGDATDAESVASSSSSAAAFLTADMLFKLVVICLRCIAKLQAASNSHQLSNVIAFTLAVYSQLVQHVTGRIQEAILNFPVADDTSKKKSRKMFTRRRKKLPTVNSDTEDDSDSEVEFDSDISEDEEEEEEIDLPHSSSEDDDDEDVIIEEVLPPPPKDGKDTMKEVLARLKHVDAKHHLDIVAEEPYLACIKTLSDWLRTDVEVLRNCGKTTRSLFVQLADLFNLINVDVRRLKSAVKMVADAEGLPLNEDVLLKGLELLSDGQKALQWQQRTASTMRKHDEALVRAQKLLAFGRFLEAHPETGVRYDARGRLFSVDMRNGEPQDVSPTTIDELEALDAAAENNTGTNSTSIRPLVQKAERETKRQLMKHMGQLWLAAEVRELETRVKGKMSLSPYLVVDVDALIQHMDKVKQLVYSRKFLILVPTAVLCALDAIKKARSEARDAIRWLESQFRQGNRFFRSQRHHERLPLPLIKYPKKKNKEATVYIQIIECCHFLAEQEKRAGSNLVTLLMGGETEAATAVAGGGGGGEETAHFPTTASRDFSYVGLAQSAGVNVELISEFYAKWRKGKKGR